MEALKGLRDVQQDKESVSKLHEHICSKYPTAN